MAQSLAADWGNFYVITGSAAAGLTGLTFVVIALASDAKLANAHGLRVFVTPTIVHFCAVLALSAFVSVPGLSSFRLSVGFGAGGILGLVYVGAITVGMTGIASRYVPFREDWIWHVVLPAIAYGALLAMAPVASYRADQSLYGAAIIAMLLLFIGIHNAWDVAVWNTIKGSGDST